jgi:hypothetical protein
MLRTNDEAGRSALGFAEAVEEAFRFLEDDGFRCTERGPTLVRYESGPATVNVYHGRSSYEIGVELGCTEAARSAGLSFGAGPAPKVVGNPGAAGVVKLWDVLRFLGVAGIERGTFLQASTPEAVRNAVARAAGLLQPHARVALRCDPAWWDRLLLWRSEDARLANEQEDLRRARGTAEQAWRERDWGRFVELLQPFRDSLTDAERKKLRYATDHLGGRADTPA